MKCNGRSKKTPQPALNNAYILRLEIRPNYGDNLESPTKTETFGRDA